LPVARKSLSYLVIGDTAEIDVKWTLAGFHQSDGEEFLYDMIDSPQCSPLILPPAYDSFPMRNKSVSLCRYGVNEQMLERW